MMLWCLVLEDDNSSNTSLSSSSCKSTVVGGDGDGDGDVRVRCGGGKQNGRANSQHQGRRMGRKVNEYRQVGRLTHLNGLPYLTKSQSPYYAVGTLGR